MPDHGFAFGAFLQGAMNIPQTAVLTIENATDGVLATLCQAGAGQVGAVVDHRLMMTGTWEKVQPWLLKCLHVGPGTKVLVHFKFPGDKEMPVLTALDRLRRQHGLKPLLPANTWVFPAMTTPDGEPLGKLSTACTLV
ncbi:MAG: hypothetical protein K2R98_26875 [Gemmataceae bacterium]|nr:hypothetical protein [Gemmataceae bacterium]